MTEAQHSAGFLTKVIATIFGAIVAPMAVGLGIKYISLVEEKPPTPPPPPPPTLVLVEKEKEKPHEVVDRTLLRFNGKDLTGFYTYLQDNGRDKDPQGVFSVVDGVLRISGEENGYLATEKAYGHYTLDLEYRWGEKTWSPREGAARCSGVLLHGDGPDGGIEGTLLYGYECRIAEGGTGDLVLHRGGPKELKLTVEVDPKKTKLPPEVKPKAPPDPRHKIEPKKPVSEPKKPVPKLSVKPAQYQFLPKSTRTVIGAPAIVFQLNHDPDTRDVKGFRSKADIEKPVGDWNHLQIIASASLTVVLNGTRVNAGTQAMLTNGKILIRSRGAELFVRKWELQNNEAR